MHTKTMRLSGWLCRLYLVNKSFVLQGVKGEKHMDDFAFGFYESGYRVILGILVP